MRANTDYLGFKPNQDYLIKWFWEILETFEQSKLANLLYFITGIYYYFQKSLHYQ